MKPCTYIVYSISLNKYYVGSTPDIGRRIAEHNRGKEKFTKTGMPWKIVYTEEFDVMIDARRSELFIKK